MSFTGIPYPKLPLHSVRVADMTLLMGLGACFEFVFRLIRLLLKRKPNYVRQREVALKALDREVIRMRALGPQAFVPTSKLERQQLAENKALKELAEQRKERVTQYENVIRKLDMVICAAIFLLWYGIPILEFSAQRVLEDNILASTSGSSSGGSGSGTILTQKEGELIAQTALSAMLFPLSYIGVGMRVSRWGLPNPGSSIGALLAYWSAQTFVSGLMDCADALFP